MSKYQTACKGFIIVTPRVQSHLEAHPDVIAHLQEAISKVQLPMDGKKLEAEVDMGRVIGRGGVAKTLSLRATDRTLFTLRTKRPFPSRVAPVGVLGTETTTIVIIARPSNVTGEHELITAWIGALAKKEPWDISISHQTEFDESLNFWCTTALVFDPAVMGPVFESSWEVELQRAKSQFAPEACKGESQIAI